MDAAEPLVHRRRQDPRCRLVVGSRPSHVTNPAALRVSLATSCSRSPDHPMPPTDPSRTPHLEDRTASSRSPPSILSVGYTSSPPETRRVHRFSTTTEPWPFSPFGEWRSVLSISLGLAVRHAASPRLPRNPDAAGGQDTIADRESLQPHRGSVETRTLGCVVALPEKHRHAVAGRYVRSGQSDIEAMSGAEFVRTQKRRPHMLAFQSRSSGRTLFAARTGRNPPSPRAT